MVPAETKARNLVRPKDDELLSAYSDFLDRLPLVPPVRLHRYHGAKRLLKSLKGLALDDPAVAEFLHEADKMASCFIPFLLLHGHLRPGYPYFFSRKLATLVRESALSPLADDVSPLCEQPRYSWVLENDTSNRFCRWWSCESWCRLAKGFVI